MKSKLRVDQEELNRVLSAVTDILRRNGTANFDAITKNLSTSNGNSTIPADRLRHVLDTAVEQGHILFKSEDASYHTSRSLRPHRRSAMTPRQPYAIYDSFTLPRKRRPINQVNHRAHSPGSTSPNSISKLPNPPGMPDIIPICSYCLGDMLRNTRTGKAEEMLACYGCGTSAHFSCLNLAPELAPRLKRLRWRCTECKKCMVCSYSGANVGTMTSGGEEHAGEDMVLCDSCDRGYHPSCLGMTDIPVGDWICPICQRYPDGFAKTSVNNSGADGAPGTQTDAAAAVDDLDPRLQAAALCDNLTDYEMQVIARALNGKHTANRRSRAPRATPGGGDSRPTQPTLSNNTDGGGVAQPNPAVATSIKVEEGSSPKDTPDLQVKDGSLSPPRRELRASVRRGTIAPTPTSGARVTRSSTSRLRKSTAAATSPKPPPAKRRRRRRLASESVESVSTRSSESSSSSSESEEEDVVALDDTREDSSLESVKVARTGVRRKRRGTTSATRGRKRGRRSGRVTTPLTLRSPSVVALGSEEAAATADKEEVVEVEATNQTTRRRRRRARGRNRRSGDRGDHSELNESIEDEDVQFGEVKEADRKLFQSIQQLVQQSLPQAPESSTQLPPVDNPRLLNTSTSGNNSASSSSKKRPAVVAKEAPLRCPPCIQLGKYRITTWYSAPYPSEYARLNLLYICEHCLKYFKTEEVFRRHLSKCVIYHPPGNEIYRCGAISVFEVDGQLAKLYCQQLCILAKLFLDHKTLYYDVEPFLFYVVTQRGPEGSLRLVGYFSKEKRSLMKYNLSCIMVLPPFQKQAFGRFLIDFSYLLSRIEGVSGSPEKPLSDLGRLSYESYWRSTLLPLILPDGELRTDLTVRELTEVTGIDVHDVVSTLQQLASGVVLDPQDGRPKLTFNLDQLQALRTKYMERSKHWIPLDRECLRWSPLTDVKAARHSSGTGADSEQSSQFTSPRRSRPSSPRVSSSQKAQSPSSGPQSPIILPPPPPPPPPPTTPKRRRGRPRKSSVQPTTTSAFLTSSPMPATRGNTLATSTATSTLLEAFPLPQLDSVLENGEKKSLQQQQQQPTTGSNACQKEDGKATPQKPPDSPPSGGGTSSVNSSGSLSATGNANNATNGPSTNNPASNGGGNKVSPTRTSSCGRSRESVNATESQAKRKARQTSGRGGRKSALKCMDIRQFTVSLKVGAGGSLSSIEAFAGQVDDQQLSSPVEAARNHSTSSGASAATYVYISSPDIVSSASTGEGVSPLPASGDGGGRKSSPLLPRPNSEPQLKSHDSDNDEIHSNNGKNSISIPSSRVSVTPPTSPMFADHSLIDRPGMEGAAPSLRLDGGGGGGLRLGRLRRSSSADQIEVPLSLSSAQLNAAGAHTELAMYPPRLRGVMNADTESVETQAMVGNGSGSSIAAVDSPFSSCTTTTTEPMVLASAPPPPPSLHEAEVQFASLLLEESVSPLCDHSPSPTRAVTIVEPQRSTAQVRSEEAQVYTGIAESLASTSPPPVAFSNSSSVSGGSNCSNISPSENAPRPLRQGSPVFPPAQPALVAPLPPPPSPLPEVPVYSVEQQQQSQQQFQELCCNPGYYQPPPPPPPPPPAPTVESGFYCYSPMPPPPLQPPLVQFQPLYPPQPPIGFIPPQQPQQPIYMPIQQVQSQPQPVLIGCDGMLMQPMAVQMAHPPVLAGGGCLPPTPIPPPMPVESAQFVPLQPQQQFPPDWGMQYQLPG